MIFDDLEIDTIIEDDKIYVSVSDLSEHLVEATEQFSQEIHQLSHLIKMTEKEKVFISGLINGMYNVVLMLDQSEDEYKMKQINTIDELLEKFNELSNEE